MIKQSTNKWLKFQIFYSNGNNNNNKRTKTQTNRVDDLMPLQAYLMQGV